MVEAEVVITVTKLEVQLLKGLPLLETSEGNESINVEVLSNVRTHLIQKYEEDIDDYVLLLAYRLFDSLQNDQRSWLDDLDICGDERYEILLLLATKLLRLFVQLNSTGPEIRFGEGNPINLATKAIFEELNVKSKLELDGFEISSHVKLPQLLVVAEELLKLHSGQPEVWIGHLHGWWCIRALFLHQKILDGRSVTLAGSIGTVCSAIHSRFDCFEGDKDLKTLWCVELNDIHLYYYDIVSAKAALAKAGESCGAQFHTTGVLGKRTRYQEKDLAQLVVQATIDNGSGDGVDNSTVYLKEFRDSNSLQNVPLDDDTRLEKLNLQKADKSSVDIHDGFKLTTIQQIVLLAELNYVKKSQPRDELLREGIMAYVRNLTEDPKLWSVLMVALMHRSTIETDHFRTIERSMMQFENIQRAVCEKTPSFNVRYQFYHAASMPLIWEIEVALADVLCSLGQTKNALDIYLRLNMWENVIACYNMLELRHKAEEVIREQILISGETPKLLVYLGDATSDISYYERAWILSEEKSSLSQQRLGVYWFKKKEYEQSIPYLQKAVELNPLENPVWVRLGYAAIQVENWTIAAKAYTHANNLDDESFENWNNLANATLKLGNKDQALRALKQATKCSYDQWKVWENLMLVALQCYDIEWTAMAFNRLLDLKGTYVDEMVLRLLVDLVSDDSWDEKGDTSARCKDLILKLFGRLSSKVTTNAEVWQSYSTLLYRMIGQDSKNKEEENLESAAEKWHKLIQYQQKAMRCHLQNGKWDKLPEITLEVVTCVHTLCIRTREFLNALPSNPSSQDFKTQAEFLHKQVANTIAKKIKEVPDPTMYEELSSKLKNSFGILSGELPIEK